MFAQVIQGKVADSQALKAQLDRWVTEVAPGSIGWLGTTAGVTADGTFLAIARFEDAAKAQANSDRPEQDKAWGELSELFTGEVSFMNSEDVLIDLHGDPNEAGFVQVIRGRTSNAERARELMSADSDNWAEFRPDIIGTVSIIAGDQYALVAYFRSEAEAREGEKKEMPDWMQAQMEEMSSLEVGEPSYFDLTDPWMSSPQ